MDKQQDRPSYKKCKPSLLFPSPQFPLTYLVHLPEPDHIAFILTKFIDSHIICMTIALRPSTQQLPNRSTMSAPSPNTAHMQPIAQKPMVADASLDEDSARDS